MTPENDLTLRGIFRPVRFGIDEWEDRRDYRLKYEKSDFDIGLSRSFIDRLSFLVNKQFGLEPKTILEDRYDPQEEEAYMIRLCALMPETKTAMNFESIMAFGMGKNSRGYYTCDCCGIELNVLNSFNYRYLCEPCDLTNEKEMRPEFKL